VAEGAGAASLAAALGHQVGGKVVCVVSGGNIDGATLATILTGRVPV
jgi:threonine dehydratase